MPEEGFHILCDHDIPKGCQYSASLCLLLFIRAALFSIWYILIFSIISKVTSLVTSCVFSLSETMYNVCLTVQSLAQGLEAWPQHSFYVIKGGEKMTCTPQRVVAYMALNSARSGENQWNAVTLARFMPADSKGIYGRTS